MEYMCFYDFYFALQNYYKFLEYAILCAKIIVYARISVCLGTKDCCSHNTATVSSGELRSKAESEVTTNFWNMQKKAAS